MERLGDLAVFLVPSLTGDTWHKVVDVDLVLRCDCMQWLRRRRCVHVAIVETKFGVPPPPFLTDLMDVHRKQLLKEIAVGPHATAVKGVTTASAVGNHAAAATADHTAAATTDFTTAATTTDNRDEGGFGDDDFVDAPTTDLGSPTVPADLDARLKAAFLEVEQMDPARKLRILAFLKETGTADAPDNPRDAPDNPRRKRRRRQKKGKQSRF